MNIFPFVDWSATYYAIAFWVIFAAAPVVVGAALGSVLVHYSRRLTETEGTTLGLVAGVLAIPPNWLALAAVTKERWPRVWDAPNLQESLPWLFVLTLPGLVLNIVATVLACLWLDARKRRLARVA